MDSASAIRWEIESDQRGRRDGLCHRLVGFWKNRKWLSVKLTANGVQGEWSSSCLEALVEIVQAGFSSAIDIFLLLSSTRSPAQISNAFCTRGPFGGANGPLGASRSREFSSASTCIDAAPRWSRHRLLGSRVFAVVGHKVAAVASALPSASELQNHGRKTKRSQSAYAGARPSILGPATDEGPNPRSERAREPPGRPFDPSRGVESGRGQPMERTQDCAVKETGELFSSLLLLAPPLTSSDLQPDPALLYERKRRKGRRSELKGVGRGFAAGGPRLHVRVPRWTRPTC
jgi:hypothetical protein